MKDEYISKHAKSSSDGGDKRTARAKRSRGPARTMENKSAAAYSVRDSSRTGRTSQASPAAGRKKSAKKKGPSAAVIIVLLLIILLAAAVLAGVWYYMLRPGAGGVDPVVNVTPTPAETQAPVTETPELPPAAEVTEAPVPEETPAPPEKLVYEADYSADADALLSELSEKHDANGHTLTVGETGIDVTAADGSSWTVPCDGYIDAIIILGDGRGAASAWTENDHILFVLSQDSGSVEKQLTLGDSVVAFGDGNASYSYFCSDGTELYGVNAENGQKEWILNWTEADVAGSRVCAIKAMEDGSFACLLNVWDDETFSYAVSAVNVNALPESAVPEKKKLVLLTANPVESVQDAIVSFNLGNEETDIVMKAVEFSPDGDPLAEIRTYADTYLEGKLPDVYDLTGLPFEEMALSDMLEDLTPYLSSDAELSEDSVLSAVMDAAKFGGKLYSTCSGFSVSTVVGPGRLFSSNGWTPYECSSIASTMGQGTYLFGPFDTQQSVLYDMLAVNFTHFVDWQEKTCNFNMGDFNSLLELVKKVPVSGREADELADIKNNVQLLRRSAVYSPADLAGLSEGFTSPKFIGMPSFDSKGNGLTLNRDYAVSASCTDKEAAWQFVRMCFTEEYQAGSWDIPSNVNAFENYITTSGAEAADTELFRTMIEEAVPADVSPAVFSVIWDACKGYLTGGDSVYAAAEAVQNAMNAYLSAID